MRRSDKDIRERHRELLAEIWDVTRDIAEARDSMDIPPMVGLRDRLRAEAHGLARVLEIKDKEA